MKCILPMQSIRMWNWRANWEDCQRWLGRWWGNGVLGLLQICSNWKGTLFTKMHDEIGDIMNKCSCEEYLLNQIIFTEFKNWTRVNAVKKVACWTRQSDLMNEWWLQENNTFPLTFRLAREHNTQPELEVYIITPAGLKIGMKPFRIGSVSYD